MERHLSHTHGSLWMYLQSILQSYRWLEHYTKSQCQWCSSGLWLVTICRRTFWTLQSKVWMAPASQMIRQLSCLCQARPQWISQFEQAWHFLKRRSLQFDKTQDMTHLHPFGTKSIEPDSAQQWKFYSLGRVWVDCCSLGFGRCLSRLSSTVW